MIERSLAVVMVAMLSTVACPQTQVAEGEGEGEGDGDPEPIDVGPPPSGYAETPPATADGVACATGQWWTRGDRGTSLMHPGGDCIDCHEQEDEGPSFTFAGTVHLAYDDETDCRGVPDVLVELIGPDDEVFYSNETNSAGSFSTSTTLTGHTPYTARLTYAGRTRTMTTPQTDGACNSCHSAEGSNDAPGRIVVP